LPAPAPLVVVALALAVVAGAGRPAFAEPLRYFAIWSYTENAPSEEIRADQLRDRKLGYWAMAFDDAGEVVGGTFYFSAGTPWFELRYVSEDDRVWADVYSPSGVFLTRKTTTLRDRKPQWPEAPPDTTARRKE